MKSCSKCCEEKPLDAFGMDKSRSDGKTVYCKVCLTQISKVIRKRHIAKRTAYNKQYRESNREKYNEWERKYYSENSPRLGANAKKWRCNVDGTFIVMHLSARSRARRKHLDYVLTPDVIKALCAAQGDKCALTGIPFDYAKTDEFSNRPFAPSIDRKDSGKGYTFDNIQITCVMVNKAKNEFRQEMFDAMCMARVRHINGG